MSRYCSSKQLTSVLIESDWNLKHAMMDIDIAAISINRIRLEFKDYLII